MNQRVPLSGSVLTVHKRQAGHSGRDIRVVTSALPGGNVATAAGVRGGVMQFTVHSSIVPDESNLQHLQITAGHEQMLRCFDEVDSAACPYDRVLDGCPVLRV